MVDPHAESESQSSRMLICLSRFSQNVGGVSVEGDGVDMFFVYMWRV